MYRGIRSRSLVAMGVCLAAFALTTQIQLKATDEFPKLPVPAPVPAVPADLNAPYQTVAPKDPSHYVGARACLDCHRSEYVSWLGTEHYFNSVNRFEGTENSIDTKYKEKVGNLDLCYTCHMAPADDRFGRVQVETGTSCESCHGAAGGEDGWLNRHAAYGPNITRREHETPQHQAERLAHCDSAGMIRAGRPYEVAKNCFSCHIIGDATLVSEDVKHPVSFTKFSLIPYMQGEVRHNFHMNQRVNAETPTVDTLRRGQSLQQRNRIYLILEQFAKAEVALNHVAALPSDEAMKEGLAESMGKIFKDAAKELKLFAEVLEEPDDEDIPGLPEDELAPLLAVVESFATFDDLDEPTRADAAKAARSVAEAAAAFLALHDGSKLTVLDEEFLEDLSDPVGKVLAP